MMKFERLSEGASGEEVLSRNVRRFNNLRLIDEDTTIINNLITHAIHGIGPESMLTDSWMDFTWTGYQYIYRSLQIEW